jgi:hypothetical protein
MSRQAPHLPVLAHGLLPQLHQTLLHIPHAGAVHIPEAKHNTAGATRYEGAQEVTLHALCHLVHLVQ